MTIPKSYETLAADLSSEKILSKTLQGQKEDFMMLADQRRLDLSESKTREAALREELDAIKASVDGYDSPEHAAQVADELVHQCNILQQRMTVAERQAGDLKKLLCDVINEAPTGFAALKVDLAHRVNDALKPAEAVDPLATRPVGCCCPPKGHTGIWAAAMCPVHFGLKRIGVKP